MRGFFFICKIGLQLFFSVIFSIIKEKSKPSKAMPIHWCRGDVAGSRWFDIRRPTLVGDWSSEWGKGWLIEMLCVHLKTVILRCIKRSSLATQLSEHIMMCLLCLPELKLFRHINKQFRIGIKTVQNAIVRRISYSVKILGHAKFDISIYYVYHYQAKS